MKTVKLRLDKKRLLNKFDTLKKLAVKKGYGIEIYDNYIKAIFMTSKNKGVQIRAFRNDPDKDTIYLSDVNYSNNTFYIEMGTNL